MEEDISVKEDEARDEDGVGDKSDDNDDEGTNEGATGSALAPLCVDFPLGSDRWLSVPL